MKTSELTGAALNWAVNHAERLTGILAPVNYCGKWEHGGPIIEREEICIDKVARENWCACVRSVKNSPWLYGPTPLIAAMRCYVASKLGDDIEIPEELK
jgi:hypothetical protein